MSALAKKPQRTVPDWEFLLFYHCPTCRREWEDVRNVIIDEACPSCGDVSAPRAYKQRNKFTGRASA